MLKNFYDFLLHLEVMREIFHHIDADFPNRGGTSGLKLKFGFNQGGLKIFKSAFKFLN